MNSLCDCATSRKKIAPSGRRRIVPQYNAGVSTPATSTDKTNSLDKQNQFEPGTNLKGWLFTIMRNRFYSDLRTQRRRPASIDSDMAPMLTAVDNPEATLALKELSSALFKLSPQSREALVLVGAGGFSYEEAVALCGCSVGTLKARVSRARKHLSEKLG